MERYCYLREGDKKMNVSINNGSFIPEIQQLPLDGKDIVTAIETVKMAIGIVKEIGNAIMGLAKELGLVPDMEVEELGARVIQGMEKGIRPENFATTEEWVNKLMQDAWGYDPEKSESLSKESKVYMGIGTVAAFLVDKFEQLPIKDFLLLASANPALFTVERMTAILGLIAAGSNVFSVIVQYLSGNDKSRETVEIATDTLVEIEKKINPELDDNEAYKTVLSYCK